MAERTEEDQERNWGIAPTPRSGPPRQSPALTLVPALVLRDTLAGSRAFRAFCTQVRQVSRRRCSESCVERALRRFAVAHQGAILKTLARQDFAEREIREEDLIAALREAFTPAPI